MTKRLTGGIVGFIIGVTLAGVAAFNPAGWSWLTSLRGTGVDVAGTPPQAEAREEGERRIAHWRAPMDASFVSDRPGTSPQGHGPGAGVRGTSSMPRHHPAPSGSTLPSCRTWAFAPNPPSGATSR